VTLRAVDVGKIWAAFKLFYYWASSGGGQRSPGWASVP